MVPNLPLSTDNRYADVIIRLARPEDRPQVIQVIDSVAGEQLYLQTDRYRPTPIWERLLSECMNVDDGFMLLIVEENHRAVGFARLSTDWRYPLQRRLGNIGIALLPAFRSKGIGLELLSHLIAQASGLGFSRLGGDILATNSQSLRLFMQCGFISTFTRRIHVPCLHAQAEELYVQRDV